MLASSFEEAATVLKNGGIIAYPTEAVWGLGCIPENRLASYRILELKGRLSSKGLIIVAASIGQLSNYLVGLSQIEMNCLTDSWPGPVTWLIPDNGFAPQWIKGEHDTVAVRVSDHPVIQGLCRAVDSPLVSTSANIAGQAPIRHVAEIRRSFGDSLDYIFEGDLGTNENPTEIRHLREGHTVRKA